jgi:hypothetical protein
MNSAVSCDVTPCSLIKVYRRFGREYCNSPCNLADLFLNPEDGIRPFLWNVSEHIPYYTAPEDSIISSLSFISLSTSHIAYYYYLIQLQMDFTRWQCYYNETQHRNTNITQNNTPHSNKTQHKKLNNKGHITHNEYDRACSCYVRRRTFKWYLISWIEALSKF